MPRRAARIEIFLGDFIDRGPHSAGVVEWLTSDTSAADERICLLGNHEDMLLEVLYSAEAMPHWLGNGGLATLLSYNVVPPERLGEIDVIETRNAFLSAFPPHHRDFMRSLRRLIDLPPYLFVHAGIRPGIPIERQDPHDLVWIRGPFLSFDADFGRIVVHGHTPVEIPDIRRNRVNIDTGAVFSGKLTCLVLEGEGMRLLQADAGFPDVPG